MKTSIRTTLKFFSFSLLTLMCACGAPKRSTETETNTGVDPSTPLFDTSSTSPTGTSTENLFTTQTGTQLQQPVQGSGNLSNVSQQESACLTNDSSFNLGSYGARPRGTTSTGPQSTSFSCLNSSENLLSPEPVFGAAITSYEAADYCLGQAASMYAPQVGQSRYEMKLNMQLAELGLIRCMRDIIGFQGQAFPWANAQTAAFQHADHNVWYIGQGLNYQ